MVLTEQPAAVGEDLAAQLLGFGVTALQAQHPGDVLAGGEGVGVAGAQDALPVGEDVAVLLFGVGVDGPAARSARPGCRGW